MYQTRKRAFMAHAVKIKVAQVEGFHTLRAIKNITFYRKNQTKSIISIAKENIFQNKTASGIEAIIFFLAFL